jgi:hypothetical protein
MKHPYKLVCRFYNVSLPIYFILLTALFIIHVIIIMNYYQHHSFPGEKDFFIISFFSIMVVPLFLPIPFASMLSNFSFSTGGVVEERGYLWGLYKKRIITPWTGFESWDKSYYYSPVTRESIPQINLYEKPARLLHVFRFNPKATSKCKSNDRPVKWDTFSKHLIEIFEEVNLPNMKPEVEKKRISVAQNLLIGTAALLLLMIIVAGVLSLILGRINWYSAVVISGIVAIVGAVFMRKKK